MVAIEAQSSGPAGRITSGHYPREQLRGPSLVEGLVEVAALGRLHARGAARLAGALRDQPQGVSHQALERVEAGARDADAARVAVVDEHGGPPGLVVEGGGEAA